MFLISLALPNLYSQYKSLNSTDDAPWALKKGNINTNLLLPNPNTVGYSYYMTQTGGSQLFRFNVGSPNMTTLIGTPQALTLGNGDFANPTGVWKFYVQSNIYSPFTIY